MKFLKYFLCFIILPSFATDSSAKRSMIILLNQEDNCENIGQPYRHFLSCKFQSALQEKCSPVLINASLINAFIEKRKSIEQMSKRKGTAEENVLNTYRAINQRLNTAYAYFRGRGFDPLQSKQLMLDEVNKQFYAMQAIIESPQKPISNHAEQALRAYVTKFNINEWNIYTNNKSLYLFVPKNLVQSSKEIGAMHQDQCGLKVSSLIKVADIEDAVKLYFDAKQEKKYPIAEQLHDFFITKSDSNYHPYQWDIIFSGHGGTNYVPETDSYSEPTIADLPISDFQNILNFFQNQIKTHSFHYATCFGSGKRIQMAFDNTDNARYDFPIISDCTSDGEAYCMVRNFKLPNYNGKQLEEYDIISDQKGNWQLNLDYGYNWTEYFNQMSQHSFENDQGNTLCKVYDTLNNITQNMISNIPQIRLPHAKSFIPALSNNTTVINDAFVSYHQEQSGSAYTMADRFAILVHSKCVPFPLIFNNENNMPHIISLIPGPSKQYFKKLTFKTIDHALNAFWPVPGDRFNRHFIIEQIEFPHDKNSETLKHLDLPEGNVALQNVMIHAQTEDILRILFQTKDGKSHMIVANKTDAFAQQVSLKGIHQLTPEVAQIYLSRYNQMRQELVGSKVKDQNEIT